MKNRNFWAYYPLILVLINTALLIPAFMQFNKLEMAGIPVLFNMYIIFTAIPCSIIVLIWPERALKIISNIITSLIFLPIISFLFFIEVILPLIAN